MVVSNQILHKCSCANAQEELENLSLIEQEFSEIFGSASTTLQHVDLTM